ncbi:MAG: response regulator [Polyangiaceae bacterium]|nr:response regulator [Polyangiaceae bacterium]
MEKRLLDHLPTPVVCEDGERRVVYANRAFRRLWKPELPAGRVQGRFFDLVSEPGALFVDPLAFRQRASELLAEHEAGSVFDVLLADGRELVCDYVPLFESGRVTAHVWSFRDVSEARRQAADDRAAREASDAAIAARDAFLARMSHDLRSPLGVVLGAAQLLAASDASEEQRESLEAIFNSSQMLLQLIDDVLDYSKLRAGRFVLTPRVVDLWALLDEAASTLKSLAAGKRLGFEHSIDPDLPRWARVDPGRLRQLVMNVGANAVKYTETGAVRLHAGRSPPPGPPMLTIRVEDTGQGMSKDTLPGLFDAYAQGPGHESRGTGLGLAITRELVELMGGSVQVESAPGIGTTFGLSVRIEPARPSHTLKASRPPPPLVVSSGAGRRILIAEDNFFTQVILKRTVERLGHAVEVAQNGLEVIDALGVGNFDAVIMDCQMPLLDGYSTTARLRELGYDRAALPVIALTASAVPGDREKCLRSGMNDYLTKPFTLAEVGATLERWLSASPRQKASKTAPPEEPAQGPLDLRRLEDLSGGDAAVLADVCAVFVEDMGARLEDLERAAESADAAALRRIAHVVAGSASNVGARTLESLARDVELDRVRQSALFAHVAELRNQLDRVRGAMTRLCGASPASDPSASFASRG